MLISLCLCVWLYILLYISACTCVCMSICVSNWHNAVADGDRFSNCAKAYLLQLVGDSLVSEFYTVVHCGGK